MGIKYLRRVLRSVCVCVCRRAAQRSLLNVTLRVCQRSLLNVQLQSCRLPITHWKSKFRSNNMNILSSRLLFAIALSCIAMLGNKW